MGIAIGEDPWIWVVVMDPGGNEQFVGQQDEVNDISFIPAFLEREEALMGIGHLSREEGHSYEVQAVRYRDLALQAAQNGFEILILNGAGEVLERIIPDPS